MAQTLDEDFRQTGNIGHLSPDIVVLQNRDDFVISLAAIDGLQAPDHPGGENHFCSCDLSLADDVDVKGIAVPMLYPWAQGSNPPAAEGARDEAIQCGGL
jgi:hypothetical protein